MKESFFTNYQSLIHNKYIVIPVLTWFGIQLFKFLYDIIVEKKVNFKRLLGAGGMPSSHTAVAVALATLIGKDFGVDTPLFAIALIFSFVVMYDAAGIRRAAGKQARLLNKIVETPGLTGLQVSEKLVEVLGHTPMQVVVGAIIGVIVGLVF